MDFLEQIKNMSDEELESVVKERIHELESKIPDNESSKIIGFKVDSNFRKQELYSDDDRTFFDFSSRLFHEGYIKKGTKIVFGVLYDYSGNVSSGGQYYFMDNDDYIYEFCKFIKDKEVVNEYEFFGYVLDFLKKYFGTWEEISRGDMFRLLRDDHGNYFPPIKEHSIGDFKGKGNALCTEYSAVAQNILSLFGFYCSVVIGNERTVGERGGMHAFNIVSFDEKESGREVNALVDFSSPAVVHDINFNKIGLAPYIIYLNQLNQEFLDDLIFNGREIVSDDYGYFVIGNTMINVAYEKGDRCYYVDRYITPDYKEIVKK